jgi:hypothetical protein
LYTVPAKKIAPATKFLPVFDGVNKENSGRYQTFFADLGSVLHLV